LAFGSGLGRATGSFRAAGGAPRPGHRLEAAVCWRASPENRAQEGWLSIGEHVLVVRHRIDVQAGLVDVGARAVWWRRSGRPASARARAGRRVVPGAQVPEDLLHCPGVINDGDNAHRILANGTPERVHVPAPEDEITPAFGGEFGWRWRRNPWAADNELRRLPTLRLALTHPPA
jgi:hypothetical protein